MRILYLCNLTDERRLRLLLVVRATFMEFKRCIFILLKSLCTSRAECLCTVNLNNSVLYVPCRQ